jgi:putative hydrolase of the HAD superfamily
MPLMPTSIQALLFDLDNTLLDRTRTFLAFAGAFISRYFPELTDERRSELIRYIVEEDEDGYRSKPELFRQLLDDLPFAPSVTAEELLEFYFEHYPAHAAPMEGAEELLDLARRLQLRVGLVTNGLTRVQMGKIRRLGWESAFNAILISEAAGCKKPDPAIFRKALEQIGADPAATVFVGDHPRNDIIGAAGAGMRGIWLRRNQPWPDGVPPALLTVDHLDELKEWLRNATA